MLSNLGHYASVLVSSVLVSSLFVASMFVSFIIVASIFGHDSCVALGCEPPTPIVTPAAATESTEATIRVSSAEVDSNEFRVHTLHSPYQAGPTQVRVLVPDAFDPAKRYRLLYVLPVEPGVSDKWGDGLIEVRKTKLHNRHQLICIEPTFSHLPWYCDHASDPSIRQESHLLKVVLPHVEKIYQASVADSDRLLVGFSKSGWGAFSLLLRHPTLFGKAVAWDAPLMMHQPNKYGMKPIFGTQQNFEQYELSKLFAQRQSSFGKQNSADSATKNPRLAIHGIGNFLEHHDAAHRLLQKLEIPHAYTDGPKRIHRWDSGWLETAVNWLAESAHPPK